MRHLLALIALLSGSLALTSCSRPAEPAGARANANSVLQPVASIQEIMDAQVDPAADALWGAVGSSVSLTGTRSHRPQSEAEWQQLRREALQLIEATNLIVMPGRRVSAHGTAPEADGEPDAAQMQQHVDATRAAFDALSSTLRASAREMLRAVDARDADAMLASGEHLEQACEACHMTYWYPNQDPAFLQPPTS